MNRKKELHKQVSAGLVALVESNIAHFKSYASSFSEILRFIKNNYILTLRDDANVVARPCAFMQYLLKLYHTRPQFSACGLCSVGEASRLLRSMPPARRLCWLAHPTNKLLVRAGAPHPSGLQSAGARRVLGVREMPRALGAVETKDPIKTWRKLKRMKNMSGQNM